MENKTTIPISEARQRIFDIAEEVQIPGTYFMFTEKGRPKMVAMSADEFESWQETLEVMRDFPDLDKDITETRKDFKSEAYRNYPTLDEVIKKAGYTVKSQSHVSSSTQTKRSKNTRRASRAR